MSRRSDPAILDTIRLQKGQAWRNSGVLGGSTAELDLPDVPPPPSTPGSNQPTPTSSLQGPRPSVGAATLANIGKGTSENQDAYVVSVNDSGTKCFVAVFDGHGEHGHHISGFAKRALPSSFFSHDALHDEPKMALEDAYDATQHQIECEYHKEAAYSGTTAVAVYQHRNRLLVANVGDSRAVLGVRCGGHTALRTNKPVPGPMRAVELSRDHKPSRPDEKTRITAEGGIVAQGAIPVQTGDGIRMVKVGPERIMDKKGMGGLAVSRAFGDLNLRPYVSSKPEVVDRRLGPNDKVIILGSDGVWDHVSSQEAVDIAGRVPNPGMAARMIADVARKRWRAETQGCLSDDITAVVVNLEHEGASAPGLLGGQAQGNATRSSSFPLGQGQRTDWTLPSLSQAVAPAAVDVSNDLLRNTSGGRSGNSRRGRRSPSEAHSQPAPRRLGMSASSGAIPTHQLPAAGLRRQRPSL